MVGGIEAPPGIIQCRRPADAVLSHFFNHTDHRLPAEHPTMGDALADSSGLDRDDLGFGLCARTLSSRPQPAQPLVPYVDISLLLRRDRPDRPCDLSGLVG